MLSRSQELSLQTFGQVFTGPLALASPLSANDFVALTEVFVVPFCGAFVLRVHLQPENTSLHCVAVSEYGQICDPAYLPLQWFPMREGFERLGIDRVEQGLLLVRK